MDHWVQESLGDQAWVRAHLSPGSSLLNTEWDTMQGMARGGDI